MRGGRAIAVVKLNPESKTRIKVESLLLEWHVAGMPGIDVRVEVVQSGEPSQPAAATQPTGPSSYLIAALPTAATVLVRPAQGERFVDGAKIGLQVTARLGGGFEDQLVVPTVNVSGIAEAALLQLMPDGDVWELYLPPAQQVVAAATATPIDYARPQPALRAPDSGALSGLAERAFYRARALAGRTGSVPDSDLRELHIAIDRSASMLPHVRSGARHTLLEVLVGVNDVVNAGGQISVWQLGTAPTRVRADLRASTLTDYDAQLGSNALTTGTVLAPLVRPTASSTPRSVVVLTDGVAADLDDLERELHAAAVNGSVTKWHVLAIARSSGDPAIRAEPWRDELAPLTALVGPTLSVSAVSPGEGAGWLAKHLEDDENLAQLIRGLNLIRSAR